MKQLESSSSNISQRAYFISESLRRTTAALFVLFFVVIGSILFAVYVSFTKPADIAFVRIWLPYILIVISPFFIWYLSRARRYNRELKEWKEDYLEQTYIVVFDTTLPNGSSTVEKVLNLARLVFPELESRYRSTSPYLDDYIVSYFRKKFRNDVRQDISKSMNIMSGSYSFDMGLKTPRGYFIIKVFDRNVVTIADLKELIETASQKFKDKYRRTFVFRILCVAKEYDKSLLQSMQEQITKQLGTDIKLDLLIEEKVGYSVLWVS